MGLRWHRTTDEHLLGMRLCDLPVRIEGTPLEGRVRRLYDELEERGIRFKPHVWLAEEWFSPDGVPGIAIPFYLAHPRLIRLERKMMLAVEGGTDAECMRLLRHEAGHALDTAFRLHFKRRWRELFGSFAEPYPDSYTPVPNSRSYVLHLDAWYAQAHPAEDFAETFAVWLTPGAQWRRRYRGWAAFHKLQYVDRLMAEVAGMPPRNDLRTRIEPLSRSRLTLGEHYARRRRHYALQWPAFYDRDLRRIFSQAPRHRSRPTAASLLRHLRRELCQAVSAGTGVHQYTINYVLQHMIERCKRLKLRVPPPERRVRQEVIVMLTVQTMHVIHSGHYRLAV